MASSFSARVSEVKASYKDGILTITLDKTEQAKTKRIEVRQLVG